MDKTIGEIVKQGKFKVKYSSAKRYLNCEGELKLTKTNLSLDCPQHWIKTFDVDDIRLGVSNDELIVEAFYYGKTWFRLEIDKPRVWLDVVAEVQREKRGNLWDEIYFGPERRSAEMKKLFDIGHEAFIKLYNDTRQERERFLRKNIFFNLKIQEKYLHNRSIKDRKLRAFIIAHSYVAWYEWTKKILRKVIKAKKGKGPKNDKELLDFLEEYPYLKKAMDTTKWGLEANQIRNCVAHEKFYFDYKKAELVFMLETKEKRIRMRDLEWKTRKMADFYIELFSFLRKRAEP